MALSVHIKFVNLLAYVEIAKTILIIRMKTDNSFVNMHYIGMYCQVYIIIINSRSIFPHRINHCWIRNISQEIVSSFTLLKVINALKRHLTAITTTTVHCCPCKFAFACTSLLHSQFLYRSPVMFASWKISETWFVYN